jgi:hypothetical protein
VRSAGVRESVIGRPGGIFFQLDDIFFQLDDKQDDESNHLLVVVDFVSPFGGTHSLDGNTMNQ